MRRSRRGAAFCLAAWLASPGLLPGRAAAQTELFLEAPDAASAAADTLAFPDLTEPRPAPADSASTPSWLDPGKPRTRWGLIGSAVGVVAGVGLALWVKSEADDRFDLYLRTADPETASDIFEEAERYDRAALVGFGIAQISFVAMVYFLARSNDRELVPIQGEPVVRVKEDGAEVGVRFHR